MHLPGATCITPRVFNCLGTHGSLPFLSVASHGVVFSCSVYVWRTGRQGGMPASGGTIAYTPGGALIVPQACDGCSPQGSEPDARVN